MPLLMILIMMIIIINEVLVSVSPYNYYNIIKESSRK